jgi:hypothetical protein
MDRKAKDSIVTTIGIDIGKTTFHLVGLDERGAILFCGRSYPAVRSRFVLRTCLRAWLAWRPASALHHLSRQLLALGHR